MWRRLLVVTGLAALAAWLLRRERAAEPAPSAGVDPSDELRQRLDEARRREESAQAEETIAEPPAPDGATELDARRQDVHDRARAAVDEMHGSTE